MKKLIPLILLLGILAWIYPFPNTRVLVFTSSKGYHHVATERGVTALQQLGEIHGFDVTATDDPSDINEPNLSGYQAVVFLNTAGDVLDHIPATIRWHNSCAIQQNLRPGPHPVICVNNKSLRDPSFIAKVRAWVRSHQCHDLLQ